MNEKRFELSMNGNEVAQYEIIDHNQENLTVYNDLGNVYFSSAMKICELLNNLENENKQLKLFKEKVFELIDKKINKLKNTNEVSLIPRESVEILKELKKELQE